MDDSQLIYKVYREPERRVFVVGYRGNPVIDAGYFFCPYIPGHEASKQEIYEYEKWRQAPETEFQHKVFWSIKKQPMMRCRL